MTNRWDPAVLITGGAGFIGSHVARELASVADVTVLDTSEVPAIDLPETVTNETLDVRNDNALSTAVANAETVIHLAAAVSVARSTTDPLGTNAVNLDPMLSILEAAREHTTRVIFASSAAIYGHPQTLPIAETHPTYPTSPYGIQKLTGDHYARLYHDLYDLETVALRYFNVYGPGQSGGDYAGVVTAFISQALDNEPITVHGDGEQTRDFVFVDDVVQANRLAADTDAVGEAFNIGTGSAITIRELAELIQDITDTHSDIVHTDARAGDIEHSKADIENAKIRLGYEPTVSLEEGLERTVTWFRAQRHD